MPLYRGAQKVTPRPGGQALSRVYRGDRLVWTSAPAVTPATLGAIHWLPFTTTPGEDLGSHPIAWGVGSSVVSGGALKSGIIQMPYPGSVSPYTPMGGSSFTGWIYPTSTDSNIGAAPLSLSASFSLVEFRYNGGTRTAQWRFQRGSSTQQTINAGTVPDGWAHVAACMEPVSGTTWRYRAYLNGVQVLNSTYNAGTQHAISFKNFTINAQTANVNDAAAYNRPLDPTEIAALHAAGRST